MSREAYFRHFSVLISNVTVIPVSSRSNTILNIDDVACVNFNFALFKQLRTEPSKGSSVQKQWYNHRPFSPFEYKTIYEPEEMKLKMVVIHLFRQKRVDEDETLTSRCWSFVRQKSLMERVGEASLSLHTIASGATKYSLPFFLADSKGKSIIANISFELQMIQFSTNLTFHLQNFHMERAIWTSMHEILTTSSVVDLPPPPPPTMKIDFAWIDPRPKQKTVVYDFHKEIKWDRILDNNNNNRPSITHMKTQKNKSISMVTFDHHEEDHAYDRDEDDEQEEPEEAEPQDNRYPEGSTLLDRHRTRATTIKNIILCVEDREVSVHDVMCGSLNARIWCEYQGKVLEMGRMVLPVAQFYKPDLEAMPLGLTERILWNEHSFRTYLNLGPNTPSPTILHNFVNNNPAVVQFNLNVKFGPDFIQLYEGKMHGMIISGEYFMGFPTPVEAVLSGAAQHQQRRQKKTSVSQRGREQLSLPSPGMHTVIISSWIASRVLTDHFLVALETYFYEIPDWFVRREAFSNLLQTVPEWEQRRQLEEHKTYEFQPRPNIHQPISPTPRMVTSIHTNDADNTIITIATGQPVHFTTHDGNTSHIVGDNDEDDLKEREPGLEMAAMYTPQILSPYETYREHYKNAKLVYQIHPTPENKLNCEQWKLKMKSVRPQ